MVNNIAGVNWILSMTPRMQADDVDCFYLGAHGLVLSQFSALILVSTRVVNLTAASKFVPSRGA